jgi:hypothetical protein
MTKLAILLCVFAVVSLHASTVPEGIKFHWAYDYSKAVEESRSKYKALIMVVGDRTSERTILNETTSRGAAWDYLTWASSEGVAVYISAEGLKDPAWNDLPAQLRKNVHAHIKGKRRPIGFVVDPDKDELFMPDGTTSKAISKWKDLAIRRKLADKQNSNKTSEFTCPKNIDAFDANDPNKLIGQFAAGSILKVDEKSDLPGFRKVIYKDPQGNEIAAYCRSGDLVP